MRGGLIAGGLFVLPGALVVLGLSLVYAAFGQVPVVAALFVGVQAAVIAIVIEALLRVSKRALKSREAHVIAAAAFAGLFLLDLPFPLIILAAAIWGFLRATAPAAEEVPVPAGAAGQSLRALVLWGAAWLVPLGLLVAAAPQRIAEIAVFFSKLALLTFGGAYALLAWMAQEVVEGKGWLTLAQMMDGLGLAETTPGPLILVNLFVGFMAAAQAGGPALGVAARGRPVDDLHPVVPVHLRGRALHRPADADAAAFGALGRDHGGGGGGDRQPVALVRAACAVRGGAAGGLGPLVAAPARPGLAAAAAGGPCGAGGAAAAAAALAAAGGAGGFGRSVRRGGADLTALRARAPLPFPWAANPLCWPHLGKDGG